ncbi:MAG: sodium:solute symporter, partial [bacterium]
DLYVSRLLTIFWGIVLTIVAFLFIRVLQSVVEIALGISSITYGGLLGTFLLGVLFRKTNQKSALWGFSSGILCMVLLIIIPFLFGIKPIVHWTWYVLIGASMTIIVGNIVTYVQNRK